jgi:hypothetical protein
MENEINLRCVEFLQESNTNEHYSVLKYLLYSNDPLERKNGESMLFVCLVDEKCENFILFKIQSESTRRTLND